MRSYTIYFYLFCLFIVVVYCDTCTDGECSSTIPNCFLDNNWKDKSLQKIQKSFSIDTFGSFVNPIPLATCTLVDINEDLINDFNVDTNCLLNEIESYLCGHTLPEGVRTFAHR